MNIGRPKIDEKHKIITIHVLESAFVASRLFMYKTFKAHQLGVYKTVSMHYSYILPDFDQHMQRWVCFDVTYTKYGGGLVL